MKDRISWKMKIAILGLSVFIACLVVITYNTRAEPLLVEPVPQLETDVASAPPAIIVINDEPSAEVVSEAVEAVETLSVPSYTEEDLYYLTHVLTGECQSAPWDEQIAVGSVVLNRVADPEFPNTIRGVIEDRHYGIQYACFYDGNFKREATQTNIEVATYLLENGSQLPANVVYQSQHRQGSGTHIKINRHYFCYK